MSKRRRHQKQRSPAVEQPTVDNGVAGAALATWNPLGQFGESLLGRYADRPRVLWLVLMAGGALSGYMLMRVARAALMPAAMMIDEITWADGLVVDLLRLLVWALPLFFCVSAHLLWREMDAERLARSRSPTRPTAPPQPMYPIAPSAHSNFNTRGPAPAQTPTGAVMPTTTTATVPRHLRRSDHSYDINDSLFIAYGGDASQPVPSQAAREALALTIARFADHAMPPERRQEIAAAALRWQLDTPMRHEIGVAMRIATDDVHRARHLLCGEPMLSDSDHEGEEETEAVSG